MQIAVNTNSLTNMPITSVLAFVQKAGVKYVEIATTAKRNHVKELADLVDPKAAIQSFGLECVCLSGGWCDFVRGDTDNLGYQLELMHKLALDRIRLFVSNPRDEAEPTRENFDKAVKQFQRLSREVFGIICIENEGGLTATADGTLDLLEAIDRPNVRTVFDPVNYMRCGENPIQAALKLDSHIAHVHAKDILNDEYVAVGDGEAPWDTILWALRSVQYKGNISIEYEGTGDQVIGTLDSLNALEKLLYH